MGQDQGAELDERAVSRLRDRTIGAAEHLRGLLDRQVLDFDQPKRVQFIVSSHP